MSKLDNSVVTNAGVRCRYRWAVSHPAPGILIDAILHLPVAGAERFIQTAHLWFRWFASDFNVLDDVINDDKSR